MGIMFEISIGIAMVAYVIVKVCEASRKINQMFEAMRDEQQDDGYAENEVGQW